MYGGAMNNMYGGGMPNMGVMGGMGGMGGMGHMMPSVLEIPLNSGPVNVNMTQLHTGKHVLRSRADYENLLKHLTSWRDQKSCDTEEAYQSLLQKTYFSKKILFKVFFNGF